MNVMPSPYQTVLDGSGNPINGAKVFVYLAGTTTKTDTYTDSTGNTANTNPIIADSAGRFVAFLDPAVSYKFVYALPTDSDPPVSPFETVDNISFYVYANSTTIPILAGETLAPEQWIYLSQGEGGTTAGRWYLTDADLEYASVRAKQIAMCLDSLTAGETGNAFFYGLYTSSGSAYSAGGQYYLSQTAGAIRSTPPSVNPRAVASAHSSSALMIGYWQTGGTTPRFTPGVGTDAAVTSGVLIVNDETQTSNAGIPLWSYTVKGGTLNADAKGLRITIWGSTAGNANNKRVLLQAVMSGGTSTVGGSPAGALAYNAVEWMSEVIIIRDGSTSGNSVGRFTPLLQTGGFAVEAPNQFRSVLAHDWTLGFDLLLTGTYVTNGDVVKNCAIVEVLY